MWTIAFATLSFVLLVALVLVLLLLRAVQEQRGCESTRLRIFERVPDRYMPKWENDTIVKFSRRYNTLHNNEI